MHGRNSLVTSSVLSRHAASTSAGTAAAAQRRLEVGSARPERDRARKQNSGKDRGSEGRGHPAGW